MLQTERLELIPFTPELVDALRDREEAAQMVGAALPEGWPDEELSEFLILFAAWVRDDPSLVGYGPWLVVARHDRLVVGSVGFQGRSNAGGEIELGFGIVPERRNRGYASEAAAALVEWGLAQPGVERVVARCDPLNAPSIRVLEKVGLTRLAEERGVLRWQTRDA